MVAMAMRKDEVATLQTQTRNKFKFPFRRITQVLATFILLLLVVETWLFTRNLGDIKDGDAARTKTPPHSKSHVTRKVKDSVCSITSISDLSQKELHPVAGDRHMVTPPDGGKVTSVCCQTTKGNLNLLLHHKWAPIGVLHYLDMVQAGYFSSSRIPLFRCTDACQFGLAGNVSMTHQFRHTIKDDPMWLPPGPAYRQNQKGVRRYPSGFITYAGGGLDSRSNQFVLTLQPNLFMGGGSPWEVPMGELVGVDSFRTLSKIYNGYGEKGPSQALLHSEGDSENVRRGWPLMDYITACDVVDTMH